MRLSPVPIFYYQDIFQAMEVLSSETMKLGIYAESLLGCLQAKQDNSPRRWSSRVCPLYDFHNRSRHTASRCVYCSELYFCFIRLVIAHVLTLQWESTNFLVSCGLLFLFVSFVVALSSLSFSPCPPLQPLISFYNSILNLLSFSVEREGIGWTT